MKRIALTLIPVLCFPLFSMAQNDIKTLSTKHNSIRDNEDLTYTEHIKCIDGKKFYVIVANTGYRSIAVTSSPIFDYNGRQVTCK